MVVDEVAVAALGLERKANKFFARILGTLRFVMELSSTSRLAVVLLSTPKFVLEMFLTPGA